MQPRPQDNLFYNEKINEKINKITIRTGNMGCTFSIQFHSDFYLNLMVDVLKKYDIEVKVEAYFRVKNAVLTLFCEWDNLVKLANFISIFHFLIPLDKETVNQKGIDTYAAFIEKLNLPASNISICAEEIKNILGVKMLSFAMQSVKKAENLAANFLSIPILQERLADSFRGLSVDECIVLAFKKLSDINQAEGDVSERLYNYLCFKSEILTSPILPLPKDAASIIKNAEFIHQLNTQVIEQQQEISRLKALLQEQETKPSIDRKDTASLRFM